ncbi:MAG: peptide deformylase [Candidatus Cryptobacteroides sp.]
MILPIYLYGQEVLRKVDAEADLEKKDEILKLVADMKDTLKVSDGCGLAAPQVGVPLRILIVDGTEMTDVYPELKDFRRTMINPVVLEESADRCTYSEGCLSVPGIYADVVRPSAIKVEYYDENFEKQVEVLDKFACRMVQHELAHLEGKLFVDELPPIRKKLISKKLQNIAAGKIRTRYRSK